MLIKTLINRFKAKQEHKNRSTSPLYYLNVNQSINDIKHQNRLELLQNLIEVTNADPHDLAAIIRLETLIELNKERGVITEFYNRKEV